MPLQGYVAHRQAIAFWLDFKIAVRRALNGGYQIRPGAFSVSFQAAALALSILQRVLDPDVMSLQKAVELIAGFDAEKLLQLRLGEPVVPVLFSQKRLPCPARQIPSALGAQPPSDFIRYFNGQVHGFGSGSIFRLTRPGTTSRIPCQDQPQKACEVGQTGRVKASIRR